MNRQKTAAENSTASAGRVVGKPFARGTSGNPGGRPKGLRQAIRQATGNGEDLVELMTRVMAGQPLRLAGRLYRPSLHDSLAAASWLADRGYGRPVSAIDMLLSEGIEKRHG
jgi:hypothetical protein